MYSFNILVKSERLILGVGMCKQCYEEYIERSGKTMLLCEIKSKEESGLARLCICQRFCPDRDKYIPHQQREQCKYFE